MPSRLRPKKYTHPTREAEIKPIINTVSIQATHAMKRRRVLCSISSGASWSEGSEKPSHSKLHFSYNLRLKKNGDGGRSVPHNQNEGVCGRQWGREEGRATLLNDTTQRPWDTTSACFPENTAAIHCWFSHPAAEQNPGLNCWLVAGALL